VNAPLRSTPATASDPAVIVLGDSHTGALQRGLDLRLRERPDDARLASLQVRPFGPAHLMCTPFFEREGDHLALRPPEFRRRVPRVPFAHLRREAMPLHALCAPLHAARVYRSLEWQRLDPPGIDEGGLAVSASMLARVVDDDQRHVMAFVEALLALQLPLVVMEPPRPYAHHPSVIGAGAARIVAVDAFYRARMRGWLASRSVPVIDVPADCVGPDGLMDPAYRNPSDEDQHHGSPAFGARMIDALLAWKESRA